MDYAGRNTVLAAGFAQMPKGTTLYEAYKLVCCVLIIDVDDEIIVDCAFTFVMDKTSDYLAHLLRGKSVANGVDEEMTRLIQERFLAPGQGAVLQSLRAAIDRFHEMRKR